MAGLEANDGRGVVVFAASQGVHSPKRKRSTCQMERPICKLREGTCKERHSFREM
jgi:hypothetical protein